ncbi:hypothetical protein CTAYLR_003400 [Chrysophaeum taylorii]|uniref:Uncharacterized protein n=1 Tax=Chrysophaeum taylorii TaxID=2483200 RepID=A0AAD7XIU3_9STRA|nr:hypothetical protein CTAYLR_003400 [Chrysophaeum taylorii]
MCACVGVKTRTHVVVAQEKKKEKKSLIKSALLSSMQSDDSERITQTVVELRLPGNSLGRAGPFPRVAVSLLGSLMRLELPNNAFREALVDVMPASCAALQTLDLSGNRFTGPVPPQLGAYRRLVELRLGKNRLVGPLPTLLGDLTKLEVLDLHTNRLIGPALPHDLVVGCGRLRDVRLGANFFDLLHLRADCPTLKRLVLHTNQLAGDLAVATVARLKGLTHLDLCQNNLSGTIPTEALAQLPLKALFLNKNAFREPRTQGAILQSRLVACCVSVDDR